MGTAMAKIEAVSILRDALTDKAFRMLDDLFNTC